MTDAEKYPVILYAEDDDDDFLLVKDAFEESGSKVDIRRVKDGEELLSYLLRQGPYENEQEYPRPCLVLLDLNMPRKDGREALRDIKSDPGLRRLPVVIVTTSRAKEDVFRTYDLGANSFIRKPIHFNHFVEIAELLKKYWFDAVILPQD